MASYNCIVVLGPTASGKTRFACRLAHALHGGIISADSRQVYRHLDIGTGKDLNEYRVEGKTIPYRMIDIAEPATQFYLHDFTQALRHSFDEFKANGLLPIVCGGTGLYLDALRTDFSLTRIPENPALRKQLEALSKPELTERLQQFPAALIAQVDLSSKKRLIRGIEIAEHTSLTGELPTPEPLPYRPYYIGIQTSLDERQKRITFRLQQRLEQGLIEETEQLLAEGLGHDRLQQLGLEYKYCSLFLQGKLNREELFLALRQAIFQFAKRQMTWFRRMERQGVDIHWVTAEAIKDQIELLKQLPWEK